MIFLIRLLFSNLSYLQMLQTFSIAAKILRDYVVL